VINLSRNAPEWGHERLVSLECDLLDAEAVKAAAGRIASEHDVTHSRPQCRADLAQSVEEAKPEDITGLAQLHLGSALTLLQGFLPSMKARRKFGRVMFNGSRAALGVPTRTAYSATKAGMIGMARTWALELAPHGITVNVVAPGPIQTDNFWGIIPKGSEREADLANRIPVGRLGTVDDVSNAFLFFCDPGQQLCHRTDTLCLRRYQHRHDQPVRSRGSRGAALVVEHFLGRAVVNDNLPVSRMTARSASLSARDGVLLDDDGGDALLLDDDERLFDLVTITGARPS
jgi:3-oxoacyl-[acyl-carrier protein] reductase